VLWLVRENMVRVRNLVAVGAAFFLVVALTVAVVITAGPSKPAVPRQPTWTVADQSHHVPAAVTQARVVHGRLVHTAAAGRLPGPVVRAATSSRAVPPSVRPRPVRLPAGGKVTEKVRVLAAPRPAAKAGYNPKTSRELAPRSASEDVYTNADGTRSAFDFALPVNYQRPDGSWAPINTGLVSEGPALSAPSAATSTPTIPASPSVSPAPSVPAAGWTERSEAEPETFAPYANAPDLVRMPLGGGHAVSFGIANTLSVTGAAQGSSVAYAGLRPGSTVRFTAGTGTLKEQIVLGSSAAPTSWVFPLDLTGLRAKLGPGGLVEFADEAGKVVAYVPHGFMSDANIDPHSGDGATSWGVTYSLTTAGGRQAIRMTLDTGWLDSKARVFPVTVDPSVTPVSSNGSTYVQYPDDNDFSTDPEVHVGTYDGGTDKAESYLAFGNVASSLQNDTVLGAELGVYNTWSYSCSPRAVYVYPVTSSWSITGNKTWPGPSTGASIGRSSFANGWVPLGSTVSPCPSTWHDIGLDQAGTKLVNGWTHGTVADDGLALGASNSDSYAWKKFSSDAAASGTRNPYLAVTYTTDGASYKLASRTPVTQVLPTQNGKFAVQVTNTGSSTWTSSNGYELSYRAYNSAGKLVADHPVFTSIPAGQTVAPGQTVTLDAVVDELPYGAYAINFDMYSAATTSSPVSFSSQGIPAFAVGLDILSAPVIYAVYPPNGYVSPTLRQQLSTVASTASGTITYSFTMTCEPLTGQTCADTAPVASGTISKPYWTPLIADMQWNTPYQWSVTTTANGTANTISGISYEAKVAQPGITAGLGGTSGQAYDPLSGNYTTGATDAAVATAGMPLKIARTYNSMDPRTSNAFGAGWSSVIDMSLRADNDGTGNSTDSIGDVVVTLSDGKQVRFGENGNGTYAGPFGGLDTLVHNSAGTWTLRDSSDDQYTFTSAGQISKITDPNGRSLLFTDNSSGQVATITDSVSARTLTLTWVTGTGAKYAHVTSVATQAPVTGQSGYAWTYAYSGDELSSVCDPTENCSSCPAGCTAYSYQTGSHYLAGVLDSGPRAYWQFGEGSGTTAADEVDANLGTTNATYSGVTLGAAGPLAGSSETAAAFNGTSSSVTLPSNLMTDSTDTAVELWFKAPSGSSGVLFSYSAHPISNPTGNHEPALYVGTNGELYGEFWTGSVEPIHTTASVADGNWHYVVLTGSSTSQSMYLDGKQVGATLTGQIDQTSESVDTIGAGYWASWTSVSTAAVGYFKGDIAQVAVYAHPLAVPDITTHYALGLAALPELTQVTLPSGNVHEQATYDPATDRLASYTDPNGGTWTIGQPLSTGYRPSSDSLGEVVDHVTVTDPAGRQDLYSYDMLDGGRLLTFSNRMDAPEAYGYDAAGRVPYHGGEPGRGPGLLYQRHPRQRAHQDLVSA
jgi:large repetitive protein